MKPPFTSTQEMYNYAANQLIVQNLSPEIVKKNLMEHSVSDADAEIVVQNMLVQIEKDKNAKSTGTEGSFASTASATTDNGTVLGTFKTIQEKYNFAADQLIVKKLSQQTVKRNLLDHGITEAEADTVIKNMLVEMEKSKPIQRDAKKTEGKKMMLVGLIIAGIGAVLVGTNFKIAGETYAFSYGIVAVGAVLFFRGLMKMF